jgi:hypothetical protein
MQSHRWDRGDNDLPWLDVYWLGDSLGVGGQWSKETNRPNRLDHAHRSAHHSHDALRHRAISFELLEHNLNHLCFPAVAA